MRFRRVFVCTMPKAGTYLVTGLVESLGFRNSGLHILAGGYSDYLGASLEDARRHPERFYVHANYADSFARVPEGCYAATHLSPRLVLPHLASQDAVVFIQRDIRTLLPSYYRWTITTGRWPLSRPWNLWRSLPWTSARFFAFLILYHSRVKNDLEGSVEWRTVVNERVLHLRFEDVVSETSRGLLAEFLGEKGRPPPVPSGSITKSSRHETVRLSGPSQWWYGIHYRRLNAPYERLSSVPADEGTDRRIVSRGE